MDILERFGNHVRDLRKLKGLSQEQLSFASELHRNYICDVERGKRNPTLKILCKISKALGISLETLMKGLEAY